MHKVTEVLASAMTLVDAAGWPWPLGLVLHSILRSVERHLARADRASLILAMETVCEARANLEGAMANRQVSAERYGNLRSRLDEMERGIAALTRKRR